MDKQRLFSVTRKDLVLRFFRAGGKGGQKQNKTSSACRIAHPESGAVGESREERSQTQNRKNALRRLVEHPRFKLWVKMKAAAILQGFRDVEHKVEMLMRPANLKVEYLQIYTCDDCGAKSEPRSGGPPEDWDTCPGNPQENATHRCRDCIEKARGRWKTPPTPKS
jgi:hypothetical protein